MSLAPKNYIANPSGHAGFSGWTIISNGGDEWKVESEPNGCEKLPNPDSVYFSTTDRSCFATSHGWCSKSYIVDFNKEGLSPSTLVSILPFDIVCSQMYASRFDCGGMGSWKLKLLNSSKQVLREHEEDMEENHVGWKTVTHTFSFTTNDHALVQQIRFLEFYHQGKDTKFWAGHYGMKFARACVKLVSHGNAPHQGNSTPRRERLSTETPRECESDDLAEEEQLLLALAISKSEAEAKSTWREDQETDTRTRGESDRRSQDAESSFPLPREDLRCPVCWELPSHHVYQCKNGHTVCETCINSLHNCPQCRVEYGNDRIRNRIAEALLDAIRRDSN